MIDIDFETRSKVDITETGAWRYASDPTTKILCMAYKLPGQDTRIWLPSMEVPSWCKDLSYIKNEGIRAHNAAFEQSVWRFIMRDRFECPDIPPDYWYDTMAQAAIMSLPLSLDGCAKALKLPIQKDESGRRTMLQLSSTRRPSKANPKIWYEPEDYPEKFVELYKYCKNDVEVQVAIANTLPPLPDDERKVWVLDQKINQRGVPIDTKLARTCSLLTEQYVNSRNSRVKELTNGVSVSQAVKLRDWLTQNGADLPNLTKMTLENAKIDTMPENAKEVILARQALSKSSTKKINAMLAAMDTNGRVQYTAVYHGASTGRWAGRLIQPQNFTRGILDKEKHGVDMDEAIQDLLSLNMEELDAKYSKVGLDLMSLVSSCLRGFISSPVNSKLIAADYSNIEGRVLAWIAGEQWKVEAFQAFDNGTGEDLYKLSYSKTFNIPIDKITKQMRQIGKVMELALGYMGGVGAFQNMARGYGVSLRPMFDDIWLSASEKHKQSAMSMLLMDQRRNADRIGAMFDGEMFQDYEDYRQSYLAGDIVKQKWREAHPNVCEFWKDVEHCAIRAVLNRRRTSTPLLEGKIYYEYCPELDVLYCGLPSGRRLTYYYPRIQENKRKNYSGEIVTSYKLTYMGTNSVTKKWESQLTYGGHLTENIVQAIARDCLVSGMINCESSGYPIIMTVHDEIVSEVQKDFGSVEEFCSLITRLPSWAQGLPLSAEGWEGARYRK